MTHEESKEYTRKALQRLAPGLKLEHADEDTLAKMAGLALLVDLQGEEPVHLVAFMRRYEELQG